MLHCFAYDFVARMSLIHSCACAQITNVKPDNWPNAGRIEMKNVVLRYRKNLDPVLNNLNLVVEAGSKVGVAGRTGTHAAPEEGNVGRVTMVCVCARRWQVNHVPVPVPHCRDRRRWQHPV